MTSQLWREWNMGRHYDAAGWRALNAGYGEQHRAYHDWSHIEDMLAKLTEFSSYAARPDLIAHAIFWHDVVYQTQSVDGTPRADAQNVAESAALFRRHTLLPENEAEAVWHMIMATAKHMHPDDVAETYAGFKRDRDLFLDIDLAALAVSETAFDANNGKIRREYAWVAEDVFCRERAKILAAFAAVEPTYKTPVLETLWGAKARANLRRSAAALAARALSV